MVSKGVDAHRSADSSLMYASNTMRMHKRLSEGTGSGYSPKRLCASPGGSDAGLVTPVSTIMQSHIGTSSLPSDDALCGADISDEMGLDDLMSRSEGLIQMDLDEKGFPPREVPSISIVNGGLGPGDLQVEPIICYGALCEAKALLQQAGPTNVHPCERGGICRIDIVRFNEYYVLSLGTSNVFAHLDRFTCQVLQQLENLPGVRMRAIADLRLIQTGKGKTGDPISISINVYGPFGSADQVGEVLSHAFAFLQHPFFLEDEYEYFNPQMHRSGNHMRNLTDLVGLSECELRARTISDEVEHVLESLDCVEFSDDQPQPTIAQPENITTPLKSHQMTALTFIHRRENHACCHETNGDLRRITGILPKDDIPSYESGGILADVMGLGKTLTMISAIVSTVNHARCFAIGDDVAPMMSRSRATLVVVTSIQVLDVWEKEILTHVKLGALCVHKFVGRNRPRSSMDVVNHDIVFTTYKTLERDYKDRRVLQQVAWYRVVLDEAHWIRNSSSDQFKAAQNLHSVRRWGLTGTPIQNRLDDLLSILKFLHFQPFAQNAIFQHHIIEPLTNDRPDRAFALRALLRTICLRRSEKLLSLPQPQYQRIDISLSPEERCSYGDILRTCARNIDTIISTKVRDKKYGLLFAAILKLRRICNHGTLLVNSRAAPSVLLAKNAQIQDGCEFCRDDEDDGDVMDRTDLCTYCGRTPDIILHEPVAPTPQEQNEVTASTFCRSALSYTASPVPLALPLQDGVSSKLQAVIDSIEKLPRSSKSLVFSEWKTTLDLLEQYLRRRNISYYRIDGDSRYKDRLSILEGFQNSEIPVLLITIKTGAVGLNLTVANYVHIVEPHWNPSVEEQAIARAIRMGQTRSVTVIRYVVKNSVEENIINLQKRKRNLAKFTLDSGLSDTGSGGLDDLKFILKLDSVVT